MTLKSIRVFCSFYNLFFHLSQSPLQNTLLLKPPKSLCYTPLISTAMLKYITTLITLTLTNALSPSQQTIQEFHTQQELHSPEEMPWYSASFSPPTQSQKTLSSAHILESSQNQPEDRFRIVRKPSLPFQRIYKGAMPLFIHPIGKDFRVSLLPLQDAPSGGVLVFWFSISLNRFTYLAVNSTPFLRLIFGFFLSDWFCLFHSIYPIFLHFVFDSTKSSSRLPDSKA